MTQPIHLAISTCPNDTFAFHGLLEHKVNRRGLEFQIELCDVQELNEGLFAGKYDVAKASFHAALLLSDELAVFDSGSALGFGVGPLMLARSADVAESVSCHLDSSDQHPNDAQLRVLCPGEHTTATLLSKLFFPRLTHLDQVVFSGIMPALQTGDADVGVCIHEGRFTWQDQGLHLIADLGELWESETKCPLPLGGILGRKSLGDSLLSTLQQIIFESIEYGLAHRTETIATMNKYAQEFDEGVLFAHVDLYVNEWTRHLGETGEKALAHLHQMATKIGLIESNQSLLKRIE